MGNEAFTATVLRSFLLACDPLKGDAAQAVSSKVSDEIGEIDDELTRELYGFFSGFLTALEMVGFVGFVGSQESLGKLRSEDARDNPAAMRRALKSSWESLSA